MAILNFIVMCVSKQTNKNIKSDAVTFQYSMKYVLGSQHSNRLCKIRKNAQLFSLDAFVKIKWYCSHDVRNNNSNFVYPLLALDSDSWPSSHYTSAYQRAIPKTPWSDDEYSVNVEAWGSYGGSNIKWFMGQMRWLTGQRSWQPTIIIWVRSQNAHEERRKQSQKLLCDFHISSMSCACPHTYTQKKKN